LLILATLTILACVGIVDAHDGIDGLRCLPSRRVEEICARNLALQDLCCSVACASHIVFGNVHGGRMMKMRNGTGLNICLLAGVVALAAVGGMQRVAAQDSSMIITQPERAAPAKPSNPVAAKPAASKPAATASSQAAASKPKPASDSAAVPQVKPAPVHTAAAAPAARKHTDAGVAVTGSVPNTVAAASPVAGKSYYIEFRSRSAQSYGHTFSVYGRLNGSRIASKTVAGLHPATESPVPWMIGHVVLVPSETGASDGDTEDQYVTARFRVVMNEAEYKKVTGYINQLRAKSPVWHAVLYNCNAFVGDIAKFMGMETPSSTMLMPEDYITSLRDLNINRSSASIIGTPVKVESASALRAGALRQQKAANARRASAGAPAANTSNQ
jgi:hypothetical protein